MSFARFEKNLTDMIKEAQLKLGFDKREITLNYAASSLSALFGIGDSYDEISTALDKFVAENNDKFGEIKFNYLKDENIYAVVVSAQGAEYVHGISEGYEFLSELISAVGKFDCTVENILSLFKKYSDNVHVEESSSGEFDLLIYFEYGEPDEYYYCFATHDLHISYHRFIKEDYESFGF